MEPVRLVVAGEAFEGWETVEIVRSLQAMCGAFRLTVSDQRIPPGPFPIAEGDPCQLYVGADLYLSGYVDHFENSIDSRQHEVTIAGRDLAQDLVDCSPADLDSEYYNIGLLELAQLLARPFGVEVRLQQEPPHLTGVLEALLRSGWEGPRFWRFSIQAGESAHEALDRACKQRGFLPLSDARGVVNLTRAGARRAGTTLRYGAQIKSARYEADRSGRFARYLAYGQRPGSDLISGADAAEMVGEAFDPVPRASRVLVLNVGGNVDEETAQATATWEANVRAARSRTLTVTINGWRERFDSGELWAPNSLVPVEIPRLGVSGEWLVDGVRLALSRDEGMITELGLAPPGAFEPAPPEPEIDVDFSQEVE